TIILPNETSIQPPAPITISDDLIITADHTWDGAANGTFDGPQLSGNSVPPALRSQDGINISAGVRVAIAGIELSGWSDTGVYVINNAGSLRADNDMFLTNVGGGIRQTGAGSMVVTNTTITQNAGGGAILNSGSGSVTVLNSTLDQNSLGGVDPGGGTFILRNSALDAGGT